MLLKTAILSQYQRPAHQYGDFIWVSCDGEFYADQENIGPIQYIPANMPPGQCDQDY